MLLRVLLGFTCLLLALAKSSTPDNLHLGRNNRTIERTVDLRTHSIFPPYIDQDLQNRWWDFGGDAYINTYKHVRLTQAKPSQTGWLWSRLPFTAHHFEIEVEFKVNGDSTHLFGDGMAMWLTKNRAVEGPIHGQVDRFEGLGIIIDTYANAKHPYAFPRIIATLGNGKTKYDLDNDGEATQIAACSLNVRRTHVVTKLKLTHVKDEMLDLKVQFKAWDEWTHCFTLWNVSLPVNPYLGFTALTGDVFDAHDIVSVKSSSAFLSLPGQARDKPYYDTASSRSKQGWTMWLFKWIAIIGLIGAALKAYQIYISNPRGRGNAFDFRRYNPNKRF